MKVESSAARLGKFGRPSLAVVGCGYWGARHVRVACETPEVHIAAAVDRDERRRAHIQSHYPKLAVSPSFDAILANGDIDAVIIATPIATHYALARAALEAGKHVLVEKPLAMSSAECQDLGNIARERSRTLMVGHTFEYHPAVSFIRELIHRGELGELYYVSSRRLNLGLYQADSNVLWDLAPHDFSIIFSILTGKAESIGAWGFSHVLPDVEDVVYAKMKFDDSVTAHLHVSWLDPVKVRQVTVVGSKGMLVFDDVLPSEKVRVYDKSFKPEIRGDSYADFQSAYHHGDVHIPRIDNTEPLKLELLDFANAIVTGEEPRANFESGLRVVDALEAASHALRQASGLADASRTKPNGSAAWRNANPLSGGQAIGRS